MSAPTALSGFPEAIDAVFPQAVNQTCIVHLVRQSLRYLSWKERKSCAGELRRIYTAPDADAARAVLDELTKAWADSKTRTAALEVWDRAWERVIPFLAFPEEIRRGGPVASAGLSPAEGVRPRCDGRDLVGVADGDAVECAEGDGDLLEFLGSPAFSGVGAGRRVR